MRKINLRCFLLSHCTQWWTDLSFICGSEAMVLFHSGACFCWLETTLCCLISDQSILLKLCFTFTWRMHCNFSTVKICSCNTVPWPGQRPQKRSWLCGFLLLFPHQQRFSYLGSCFLQGSHQSLISSFPFFPQTRALSKSGWLKTDRSWIALRKQKRVQELSMWASSLYALVHWNENTHYNQNLDSQNSWLESGAFQRLT